MEQVFLREVKERELAIEQGRSYKIGYSHEALLGGKDRQQRLWFYEVSNSVLCIRDIH